MATQHGNTANLIAAAVVGQSLRETARAAGVSISTVQRRLREPSIRAAIAEGRSQQRAEATGRLAQLRTMALDRLSDLLGDPDPGIALRAATLVLGSSSRFDQLIDIDVRLTALEAPPEPVEQGQATDDDRAEEDCDVN